jgi:hypothetical protein
MVRRSQQGRRQDRQAQRDLTQQLESENGAYRPGNRSRCKKKQWETPYDDANSVRLQFILWRNAGHITEFVVNVQVLGSDGWHTVEYFDCCHGHCHLHPANGAGPQTIARLDSLEDVQRAFDQIEEAADARARIIRDRGE